MVDNGLRPSPSTIRSINHDKGVPQFRLAENNDE